MNAIADAVAHALPALTEGPGEASVDLGELEVELEAVARDALAARNAGMGLAEAAHDPAFPDLAAFHQGLRDALLVEIPREIQPAVEQVTGQDGSAPGALSEVGDLLVNMARAPSPDAPDDPAALQRALAELLVFEAVRLPLLVAAWSSEEFETLGGEEKDVDDIAWEEVEQVLPNPALDDESVRALPLLYASATVSLARDAADRADALRQSGGDLRDELRTRARLRHVLRELRVAESVLLENALSNLLGEDRLELTDLQERHPVALAGMSRHAMDQRVSRGRRALSRPRENWPARRRPALFDLLRREP